MKKIAFLFAVLLGVGLYGAEVPAPIIDIPLNEGKFEDIKDYAPGKAKVRISYPEMLKWVDGPDGQALHFACPNGNTKRGTINVWMPRNFDLSKGYTFSLLIRPDEDMPKKGQTYIFKYADSNAKAPGVQLFISWYMLWHRTGTAAKEMFDLQTKTSVRSITGGNWYNVVMTYDGKIAKTYVDGVLANSMPLKVETPKLVSVLRIGSSADNGPGYGFKGIISNFKVFDRALTDAEIAMLCRNNEE